MKKFEVNLDGKGFKPATCGVLGELFSDDYTVEDVKWLYTLEYRSTIEVREVSL